jgi:hypothetical protein
MKKQTRTVRSSRAFALVGALLLCRHATAVDAPVAPPQDQGLAYTRSAQPKALAAIQYCVAVFAGSRYGYINGQRTRLDPDDVLGGEAVLQDGVIYVPESFAGAISADVKADPIPDDLKELAPRWVYTFHLPKISIKHLGPVIGGKPYRDLASLAREAGKQVYQNQRGLLLISDSKIAFDDSDSVLGDDVVTLFDTPDRLADPDIATRYIPRLKAQGKWTEHVKYTPDQLKLLDGPPTEYETTPKDQYDLTGFNSALLGSAVPAPGVYPRLLFSKADLPMLYARMKSNKLGQKTLAEWDVLFHKSWWDPKTDDGMVFQQLVSADPQLQLAPVAEGKPMFMRPNGQFVGRKPVLYTSHVNYYTNCLTSMALYCLLTGDDEHGKLAAKAIANYYRMIEPLVDDLNAHADSELGTTDDLASYAGTAWRGMHGVVNHMDLGLSLDFAGTWMSDADRDLMRRIIVKSTYGRRAHGENGPTRLRDVNWVTWDLPEFLAESSIEGLEGCDPEVLQAGRETVKAFLDWGVDDHGQIFESNGKNGGGIQFQILSMIVMARHGDNLWGHPHWRKLLAAQVHATAPNGKATVSSGTWGGTSLSYQAVDEIKAFYPNDLAADYLLTQDSGLLVDAGPVPASKPAVALLFNGQSYWDLPNFDPERYHAALEKSTARLRLPGPSYPSFVFTGIYDTDWKPTLRSDLNLPLVWSDPTHGELSAASDSSPDAAWLFLHGRTNQYCGSGHHHADVGMIYFSSGGVNWFGDSAFQNVYDGKYKGEVLIDGIAQPDGLPGRGTWLGDNISDHAALASIDQTQSYTWKWTNQVISWNDKGNGGVWEGVIGRSWELATDPYMIAAYRGTSHDKYRPWWPTYLFSNYIPVCQSLFNPVKYAYRTAGLVRGKHAYGIIVDDIKKADDASHQFQWAGMLRSGVWRAAATVPANMTLLADDSALSDKHVSDLSPRNGDPCLLVVSLSPAEGIAVETATNGPLDKKNVPQSYDRLVINQHGNECHYKVLMIPVVFGDSLPTVNYDPAANAATVQWSDQTDHLKFTAGSDGRTAVVAN